VSAAPRVSVLMGVFNGERFLRSAMDSVLNQTCRDIELIVIDDGSGDGTADVLSECNDDRLVVHRQQNQGLTRALIAAAACARGQYLARQDADDVSHPHRIDRQLDFLDTHPDVALVGTWASVIDADGERIGATHLETEPEAIARTLPEVNQFVHGSIMMRAEAYREVGGYRAAFRFAQDYDLVLRLAERWPLANLAAELYGHRLTPDMVSLRHQPQQAAFRELALQLRAQRLAGGSDALDRGADARSLMPSIGQPAPSNYQLRYVHTCLRHGKLRKARVVVLDGLRRRPLNPRGWLHLALTFLGPATGALLRRWDALRTPAGAATEGDDGARR